MKWGRGVAGCVWFGFGGWAFLVCLMWGGFYWVFLLFVLFLLFEENPFALMLQKAVAQCLQNTATSDNPHGGQKVCAKESSATGLILIRVLHKKGYTHKNCTGLL